MPEARYFPVAPRLVIRRDHSGYISDLRIFADPLVRLDTPLEPFSTLEDGSAVVDFHAGYSSGIPTFDVVAVRSEEHTSELQSLMRISYAVFCLKKKTKNMSNISHL